MMVMKTCKYIDDYIDAIRSGSIVSCESIRQAMDLVERKLSDPDVFVDIDKIEKGIELIEKYFKIKFLDWELFIFALIHCYYQSSDTVVFDEFFIMMGRGNGKNGFISPVAWYLTLKAHGINAYNVDIVANSQDQAETSFNDVYEMLESTPSTKKSYYRSKQLIKNKNTNSYIKFNTSNARTKDGKRTGCLIFDEIHEYENYDMISVFTSGFGKKKHSRAFYITTQGHVRCGVLDDKLKIAKDILEGRVNELGILPLLYQIDDEKDALNPELWHKANPSLKYFPELQKTMEKEFVSMQYEPHIEQEFYTKRLNFPKSNKEVAVTDWKNIVATNKPLPDLTGKTCTCGIDYTKINDMASVNLHFKDGDARYDINHSWLCKNSADFKRIVAEKYKWQEIGLLTIVDDVEISPELLTDWIAEQALKYDITEIAVDNFRYTLLAGALKEIGFDVKENKNLRMIRPSDIYKIVPVIESYFNNQYFIWGDHPLLRWATNNVSVLTSGRKTGEDTGNRYYGKIEGRSRKTDPFMALVHSVVLEEKLEESTGLVLWDMSDIY